MSSDKKYSVLLLYPDYMTDDWPYETYYDHVKAETPKAAAIVAQKNASEANGGEEKSPHNDFSPVLITEGWHDDYAFFFHANINKLPPEFNQICKA